ncbi:hypothetical protein [Aeoliella mucimassa]|uniref:Uncharacterized protein n=1 Tax=Aeoliella mucimassa TaxID=2527972 RepID=A0A518AJG4_9BACT|nr:hypothetical protein [Aeoliella mucimassa]QDU54836.1 hypothetical protein Pan181_10190 [Aeoliella mucimassa]
MRGSVDHLFRHFSLWLVTCAADRRFALSVAIEKKLHRTIDLASMPVEIARELRADTVCDMMHGILDFVRRYRGPSGKEPELAEGEVKLRMLATYHSPPCGE